MDGLQTQFRLLGPVEIVVAGRVLDSGHPRQRTVLAALLVDAGRWIPWETLIDRVWGETAPHRARDSMRAHIARLRKVLADTDPIARIAHRAGGYMIEVAPDQVDLHRFARLTDDSQEPAPDQRLDRLRTALDLWRGDPLLGLSGDWPQRLRQAWRHRYQMAAVAWTDAEIAAGNAAAAVPLVTELADEHPLNEPLTAAAMRALYATGSASDALVRYESSRRLLRDELGADPGGELQELHQQILHGVRAKPNGSQPGVRVDGPRLLAPPEPPSLLPLDVPAFVGRQEQLASLDRLLGEDGDPASVVVAAVSGTAGVGKTALAVHWAHRVRAHFPDGQLYLNLRGFDATASPVQPVEAVRVFLDALDVPRHRIPAGLTEQIGLFRSVVADRRILVVLDNARDAEQVRPLIPGAVAARVVITSRNPLLGLVVAEGARSLPVDSFSPAEADELLSRRLGGRWAAEDPAAAAELIERCGGLPLALALLAARLVTHPGFTVRDLVCELRNATDPLEVMATGQDQATDLRQVFSWSYTTLSDRGRRTFRLLGLHPGPHISQAAAASLSDQTLGEVKAALTELHDAGLLTEIRPAVYVLHDLLRLYARDVVEHTESAEDRVAAVRRMLDHYLLTAINADKQVGPHRQPIDVPAPATGAVVLAMADREAALDWFSQEHAVLVRAVDQAAAEGFDQHAWQLPWALVEDFDLRGHWHTLQATQGIAIEATRRLGDRYAEGLVLRHLANATIHLDDLDLGERYLRHALDVFEELGDGLAQATTQMNLSFLREQQGALHEANRHAEQALELYRAVGHQDGEAHALNSVGYGYALVGDLQTALARCTEGLQLVRKVGNRRAEAHTADSLGYIHRRLGDHDKAVEFYRYAVDLLRHYSDRYNEARALLDLGDVQAEAGDSSAAALSWQEAADILTAIDHPRAGEARERLENLRDEAG